MIPIAGGAAYTWDADNHLATVAGKTLVYDALGRAVEMQSSGSQAEVLYGPGGGKLALMNGQSLTEAFMPLPGGATAVYDDTGSDDATVLHYYRHPDMLGSSRMASTPSRTMYAETAYAPDGEPYATAGASDSSFTGMNQDTTAGLYDFMFRELYSGLGRWLQPDPAGVAAVDPSNPQTWNRYAYVGGKMSTSTDTAGLLECARCPDDDDDDDDVGAPWYDPPPSGGGDCGPEMEYMVRPGSGSGGLGVREVRAMTECGDDTGGGANTLPQYPATALPPPAPTVQPIPTQQPPSFAECTKQIAQSLSLQSGLQTISGGYVGNSAISSALLGNSIAGVIGAVQAASARNFAAGAQVGVGEAATRLGGRAAMSAASYVPDITVGMSAAGVVSAGGTVVAASVSVSGTLPTGILARLGAGVVSAGLAAIGTVKDLVDVAAAAFGAVICSAGQ